MSGAPAELWSALAAHWRAVRDRPIAELFAGDPARFSNRSAALDDLLLDVSKTKLDARVLDLLIELAEAAGVGDHLAAMFAGGAVNTTENRPALHAALRGGADPGPCVAGRDVDAAVAETMSAVHAFAADVRAGRATGAAGDTITDVVNLGIGGSDLGPALVTHALRPYHDGPRVHFAGNQDAADLADTLAGLDPRRTLVLVSSKSFATVETLTNARRAHAWLAGAVGDAAASAQHMAAVTANTEAATAFGVPDARVFACWPWVGGRFSVWGPMGLPAILAAGPATFRAVQAGGAAMDAHVRAAPWTANLPALLALTGVWHATVCGYPTRAVLPYDQRLARLPAHVQQLDMESNGKAVSRDGDPLDRPGAPVVWGAVGTNAQHAFFQFLHQSPRVVPCEFIVGARGHADDADSGDGRAAANALAQARALMRGRGRDEAEARLRERGYTPDAAARLAPHCTFPGDRPSVTLMYDRLDPATLGRLVALYEHRAVIEGAIWGVNSFDQWGVQLGKELAADLDGALRSGGDALTDPSTDGLLAWCARLRGGT